LNNVKSVRGADFEQSPTFSQIMCEVEQMKNHHLLNALSMLINDPVISQVGDLITELEGTLAEN